MSEVDLSFLGRLEDILEERKDAAPESSYTARMYAKGLDKILQKVGEEAVEFIIDMKNNNRERAVEEGADLIYHFLLSLKAAGLQLSDITAELEKRHSG